jgi:hypothetical protein
LKALKARNRAGFISEHGQRERPAEARLRCEQVRVRGRAQVVGLYELIPEGRYEILDWLGEFASAYKLLRNGEYVRAARRFEQLHARVGDPVSAYHAQACKTPRRRKSDESYEA